MNRRGNFEEAQATTKAQNIVKQINVITSKIKSRGEVPEPTYFQTLEVTLVHLKHYLMELRIELISSKTRQTLVTKMTEFKGLDFGRRTGELSTLQRKIVKTWNTTFHGFRQLQQQQPSLNNGQQEIEVDNASVDQENKPGLPSRAKDASNSETISETDRTIRIQMLLKALGGNGNAPGGRQALKELSLDFGSESMSLVKELEENIYRNNQLLKSRYSGRINMLIMNFKDPKNPKLKENFLEKRISPADLAKMEVSEMANDELKAVRTLIEEKAVLERCITEDTVTDTTEFICVACEGRKASYKQAAGGSPSRELLMILTCQACGNIFKEID